MSDTPPLPESSSHSALARRAWLCNWMMAMIRALILLTPNFCDKLRWNSHRSPRFNVNGGFQCCCCSVHGLRKDGESVLEERTACSTELWL